MTVAAHSGESRYIGKRLPRSEDGRLLTGRGTYVDDIDLPGMLHVAFVRSPIARGRIRSIDLSAALDLPGVFAIYTGAELAQLKVDMLSFFLGAPAIEITPLAAARVAYVGDPVALVVAQDRYIAEDAAGLVLVDYDEQAPVITLSDAKGAVIVHDGTDSNLAVGMGEEENDELEALLARAPHVITNRIKHQRIAQAPIETRGVVVAPQGTDELTDLHLLSEPADGRALHRHCVWSAADGHPRDRQGRGWIIRAEGAAVARGNGRDRSRQVVWSPAQVDRRPPGEPYRLEPRARARDHCAHGVR